MRAEPEVASTSASSELWAMSAGDGLTSSQDRGPGRSWDCSAGCSRAPRNRGRRPAEVDVDLGDRRPRPLVSQLAVAGVGHRGDQGDGRRCSVYGVGAGGRDLAITDGTAVPGVVLVNEALARRYFADQEPLGRSADPASIMLLLRQRPRPGGRRVRR